VWHGDSSDDEAGVEPPTTSAKENKPAAAAGAVKCPANRSIYKYLDGGLLSLSIDQMRAPQTHLSRHVDACAAAKLVICQEIPERNFPWQESSRTENVRFVDTFAGFCV